MKIEKYISLSGNVIYKGIYQGKIAVNNDLYKVIYSLLSD